MGRDKALLPFRGTTLLRYLANELAAVAQPITIVGPPDRYASLGLPVIADRRLGFGPLAGIESALVSSDTDWIFVLACDMPALSGDVLQRLSGEAAAEFDAVIPVTPDGRAHPLCALYRQTSLPAVAAALDRGDCKVLNAVEQLRVRRVAVDRLPNANTPEEWLVQAT